MRIEVPRSRSSLQSSEAFGLKTGIADCERLVDDENFRIYLCLSQQRKRTTHAARIKLHRLVDEVTDVGKGGDVTETASISHG